VESRTHHFPVTEPLPAVEVRNPSGSVTVEGRDGVDEITVEVTALDGTAEQLLDRVNLFFTHTRLQVEVPERRLLRSPGFAISVLVPSGSAVRVATASADTTLRGRLGDVELTSASGDVTVAGVVSPEAVAGGATPGGSPGGSPGAIAPGAICAGGACAGAICAGGFTAGAVTEGLPDAGSAGGSAEAAGAFGLPNAAAAAGPATTSVGVGA